MSLGSSGAVLVANAGKPIDIKAPKVKAVDATGAGDALNGSLAAALAIGLDLETAARRAVVAASLSVTRAGAREGMATAYVCRDFSCQAPTTDHQDLDRQLRVLS